jgi:hypothetical protein
MPTALITFRGSTVMNTNEGSYQFVPGSIGRDVEVLKLARGLGLLHKDLGTSGCEHRLFVNFMVPDADVAGIRTRVQAFYDAVEGALVIPGLPSFPTCVLVGKPEWGPQQKCKVWRTNQYVAAYRMPCSMLFVQLRES